MYYAKITSCVDCLLYVVCQFNMSIICLSAIIDWHDNCYSEINLPISLQKHVRQSVIQSVRQFLFSFICLTVHWLLSKSVHH